MNAGGKNHIDIDIDGLVDDLNTVVSDTEGLLKATAHHTGEKVRAAHDKAEAAVSAARTRLASFEEDSVQQARAALYACEVYIGRHPWRSVAIAAGAGLLLGMLISSGTDE